MSANLRYQQSKNLEAAQRPLVVLIPGGPGLSSKTLVGFEKLSRSFDLVFVDPPGTEGQEEPSNPTFESILHSIESELLKIDRSIILLGHSFGGFQAAKLVTRARLDVVGLIGCAMPLSEPTFKEIGKQYEKFRTPELTRAEAAWAKAKSKQTMKEWFASYGLLFFTPSSIEMGQRIILEDDVSLETFVKIRGDLIGHIEVIQALKLSPIKKLMIAGELDNLIPTNLLQSDAKAGGLEFYKIQNAGHFMNFDQPEAVAELIEREFIDSRKERDP